MVSSGEIKLVPVAHSNPKGKWKLEFVLGATGPRGLGVEVDTVGPDIVLGEDPPVLMTNTGKSYQHRGWKSSHQPGSAKGWVENKYVFLFPAISPAPKQLSFVLPYTSVPTKEEWVTFDRVRIGVSGIP